MNMNMQENAAGEAKGIRIEPTPALYEFLKEVQKETRPHTGRKIPLADILTSLAMMSITAAGTVSKAASALLRSTESEQTVTPSNVAAPRYYSTSTAPENVQNIWETVEQHATDFEQNDKPLNKAQDEGIEQEQVKEPQRVQNFISAQNFDHESYAREYLDNYQYCLELLQGHQQEAGQNTKQELKDCHDEQAKEPTIDEILISNCLRLDEELLPEYFPHLYEDVDDDEVEQDQEQDQEKEQAILRIVHSLQDHKQEADTEAPQDQEKNIVQEKQNFQTDENGFSFKKTREYFKTFTAHKLEDHAQAKTQIPLLSTKLKDLLSASDEQKASAENEAAAQLPSETEKDRVQTIPGAEIERYYQQYTNTLKQRILYIIKREGYDNFLNRLNIDKELFIERIRTAKEPMFPELVNAALREYGAEYGESWILYGSSPGAKVRKVDFYQYHLELTRKV